MKYIIEFQGKLQPGDLLFDKLKDNFAECLKNDDIKNYNWHLVVYLQSEQDIEILFFVISSHRIVVKQSFVECLKMIDCLDFNQLLILLSMFSFFAGKRHLRKILTPPKDPLTPLDLILAHTNGCILYYQQFETIVRMAMGVNAIEAITMRKGFNAKKVVVCSLFEKYELLSENLSDIIQNRCFTHFVLDPFFLIKGAVLLYEYFSRKPEPGKV